ncbi:hypothetical protein CDAR_493401 [Caerostris darwini]|uniref:Uncharacterized protein n=1 Tax=Caerostris darwini TaxID=1538125 RepID=A0AAV4QGH2_9ARAC|nr:hypothetical protein CDAR_493401 [Caerostris darwini]
MRSARRGLNDPCSPLLPLTLYLLSRVKYTDRFLNSSLLISQQCVKNEALTFSHQVHGSGSSLAYLQHLRGTPSQPPRYCNCAICAHDTAFVGRPLLNGESVWLRKITDKSQGLPAA